jgi:5'-deoxynucleotidase
MPVKKTAQAEASDENREVRMSDAAKGRKESQYSFFAFLSRMRQIARWSLMRNTVQENVQEHSHQVAVLAHALALIRNELFGGTLNPEHIALLALYHDATETLTGDLPTPIKYFSPQISTAYQDLEAVARERILAMLPASLQPAYRNILTMPEEGPEAEILKAADRLSALLKCVEEEKNGNREFQKARVAIHRRLLDMCGPDGSRMPEVAYFLRHFADSFEKTLDELN